MGEIRHDTDQLKTISIKIQKARNIHYKFKLKINSTTIRETGPDNHNSLIYSGKPSKTSTTGKLPS
jgi:hypothetical protein